MARSNMRVRRLIVVGAFAAAAAAAPALAATLPTDASPSISAQPKCLAWFGNKEDGKCLSYSNGNGVQIGTPEIYIGDAENGSRVGVNTGPLLPGTTFTEPIG